MDIDSFQNLSTSEIAELVRERGPRVCVFPINGTRRWFVIECPQRAGEGLDEVYMSCLGKRHVELYRLFFDHGIETLLTPIFGPDLLERGAEYGRMMVKGLTWFARDQLFLRFYDEYDVRVRVYGDIDRYFRGTLYEGAIEAYEELARRTASHRAHRLFFGVCANDPTGQVADIAVAFYREHGRPPNRREVIEAYYGEYLPPVDLFIGFDRLAAFDMPLIATGSEDLYFTVSPSPYMDASTLRAILYDHMYARRVSEDYGGLSPAGWKELGRFYRLNRHSVLGLGRQHASGCFWYPIPQVQLPPEFDASGD